jgi:hypothetical protein
MIHSLSLQYYCSLASDIGDQSAIELIQRKDFCLNYQRSGNLEIDVLLKPALCIAIEHQRKQVIN